MLAARPLIPVLLAVVLLAGCSGMVFLGTGGGNPVDDDVDEGLNQSHVVSRSVSLLDSSGAPTRVVGEVVRGQRYRVSIALAWQDEHGPGDVDRVWRFVRDGEIYGVDRATIDVDRSPFVLEIDAESTDKSPGRYSYELYVEDRLITYVVVKVVDTPTPSPTPQPRNRGW